MSLRKQVGRTRFFCYLPIRRSKSPFGYSFRKKSGEKEKHATWRTMPPCADVRSIG